jgi:Transposase DNA-binding
MPPANYDLSAFGQEHFGAAELGDQRRTKSLVDQANRMVKQPRGSLPEKLKDPNALRRLYDLMNTESITHASVLQPHINRTAQLLLEHKGVALCVHDTVELDFTSHTAIHDQVGQIGNGYGRGYECHNSLVVLPQGQRVLGLLSQQLHVRIKVSEKETASQRRDRDTRESLLWPQGADAAQQAILHACAVEGLSETPKELLLVDVCDRGGDTFEFLDAEDLNNRVYVVRSSHNREVLLGHQGSGKAVLLHDHLRTLSEQGQRQITVRDHDSGTQRGATVSVCWEPVRILPPEQQSGHSRQKALPVWALRVNEPNPLEGVKAIEWFLLTRVAVNTLHEAWERVDWYCLRWTVEEYHKAQKTGCGIELPQFETVQALQPVIALLSVVAVNLLNLRERSRDPQTQNKPAILVASQEEVEVLSGWRYGRRLSLTVRQYYLALARLGGHQNRKKDHPPGWIVLWRGWQALQLMVAGAKASRTTLGLQDDEEDQSD